ncbi:Hypothetical predicted protein [Podarcis lilfordi]|uniref:Uncharacterized protein n=1 Tax=Podarcis lilfordi TaxID=74358 RepID=A0AA35KBM2_9SAUR|nr:Hypothetical predicted protein [Podarcis lilfordi]
MRTTRPGILKQGMEQTAEERIPQHLLLPITHLKYKLSVSYSCFLLFATIYQAIYTPLITVLLVTSLLTVMEAWNYLPKNALSLPPTHRLEFLEGAVSFAKSTIPPPCR